jgi:cation diffusion facilitator CzcD-associated flavoprotein CzcO
LEEWDWTEHFSPQPETLKYIQFLTKKFELEPDMQFNTKIKTAQFQANDDSWLLTDTMGQRYSSRYIITAMGILNERTLPNIPGISDFKGESWHTARWPSEGIDALAGKRVAIIGTGATAIQTIQTIAPTIGHLTVFQRTPNWTAPLRNTTISKEEMNEIRKQYPEIFRQCLESYSCFIHVADTSVDVFALPEEERIALWEKLYAQPGFSKVLAISPEIYTDKSANEMYSKFHAAKVRARVNDPVIAEKLIPTNHGFGTRRVPLESGYYEVFNQPNVKLVDITETPIQTISEKGIKTSEDELEFDIIIYATGFDAVTGSFDAVDFQGINGTKLKDVWGNGIRTFLGLTVSRVDW